MSARARWRRWVEARRRRAAGRPGHPETLAPLYGCLAVLLGVVPAGALAVVAWLAWLADR